jgi:hypothetical protein
MLKWVMTEMMRIETEAKVGAAKSPVRTMLDRTGLAGRVGSDRMFPSVAAAAEALVKVRP